MTSVVLVYTSGRIVLLTAKMGSSVGVVIFSGKKIRSFLDMLHFEIRYLFICRDLEFSVKRGLC